MSSARLGRLLGAGIALLTAACSGKDPEPSGAVVKPSTLQQVLTDAYWEIGEALPPETVRLEVRVASPTLESSKDHAQFTNRKRAHLNGHFRIDRADGRTDLKFLSGIPFIEDRPYDPSAPLKQFVIVDVTGTIHGEPVTYQAIVARYEFKPGTCEMALIDPMLPDVETYLPEGELKALFPSCQTPLETRIELIKRKSPGKVFLGYDRETDNFVVATPEEAEAFAREGRDITEMSPHRKISASASASAAAAGECTNGEASAPLTNTTTRLCNDSWFGYGDWFRGGTAWGKVTCVPVPEGSGYTGCQVGTVTKGDDLWSEIIPGGWGACDCCDNYGAGVEGQPGQANLISTNQMTTGGHVEYAKAVASWRTTSGQTRSGIKLSGTCGGKSDLPAHGASVEGNASGDFHSDSEVHQNQSKVNQYNAEFTLIHLCEKTRLDAGTPDAGTPDAGTPDAGTPDAGTPDAGTPDAGKPDAGTPDAGTPDAGTPDAGGPQVPDAGRMDSGA
jgi:hypothetical protein